MNLDGVSIVFSLTTLFFTWWLVSNVLRRPRRATRSGHDVTGPGFNMYLPKAKACLATRFGSTDVAADGRPSEKQAAAGQLAGGGAVNAHEVGHCAASESYGSTAWLGPANADSNCQVDHGPAGPGPGPGPGGPVVPDSDVRELEAGPPRRRCRSTAPPFLPRVRHRTWSGAPGPGRPLPPDSDHWQLLSGWPRPSES